MGLEDLIKSNYFFTGKVISSSNERKVKIPPEQHDTFMPTDKVMVINLDRKKK